MIVHHITPGRADKNLGKALNQLIEWLPDNDWICVRDIDTFPLNHRVFFKQCEDIAEANEFDLVSCITNRQGVLYQCHEGKISEDFNIKNHVKIAKERYEKYGSKVEESPQPLIAGVMMLFSKQLWEDVGRFPEGGIAYQGSYLDNVLSRRVSSLGGKIGIAKGIYVFHLYREWGSDPRMQQEHLK